eukprot:TRINITY_DN70409_c0_g1_i1.p1 TRINITY_DN70409_c0_g1~~TRINITY_DN70409_c0_g1_i1.p1  ORF type:complete len:420 (+),score=135.14 TRINITY_DN70409_c0_g1_i1:75-1334(+)
MATHAPFGNQLAFCEPYWYQGMPSPYYSKGHVAFRQTVRDFVERDIKPHVSRWIEEGQEYPQELARKSFELGIGGIIYPSEVGGTRPPDYDAFYELIMVDELARAGGGNVLGQSGINSMALPPVIAAASEEVKRRVVPSVVRGEKNCCLAISEPYAGSDVANIRCTARREGDHYIVNGQKKWITGGATAHFFTTVVRTGGPGMGGISLLLIDRDTPGLSVRKMKTQFDTTHSTTFVTFSNVRVPAANLIGRENHGFQLVMRNFNHERWVIAISACRMARTCYEEAFAWALDRKTFGKRLVDHQVVRYKLAEMARQIESLHDNVERVAYAYSKGVPDSALGGQCALLKVQASRTFEVCAREASQIFGGNSIVREGRGQVVERLAREVRAQAIPGGSEEILLDFAVRQAVTKRDRSRQGKL